MDTEAIRFCAPIMRHKDMNAAYVEFPFSAVEFFGKKGQVKVKVVFDNKVEYRGSLANMGQGIHCLGLTQAIRKELGKDSGDEVNVELWEDTEERTVEIPEDVQEILKQNPEAKFILENMSYTHRKEYIRWITEAKRPETKENRKKKMIGMILSGKKGI
ncbi:MAG: YdeI/OmpD-associated family protein [Weeksellaceae bacterium]|nr:YdeI/OmpD-associated family protein [Weeksellaceae bacterium]